jgi:hypothetical protein
VVRGALLCRVIVRRMRRRRRRRRRSKRRTACELTSYHYYSPCLCVAT